MLFSAIPILSLSFSSSLLCVRAKNSVIFKRLICVLCAHSRQNKKKAVSLRTYLTDVDADAACSVALERPAWPLACDDQISLILSSKRVLPFYRWTTASTCTLPMRQQCSELTGTSERLVFRFLLVNATEKLHRLAPHMRFARFLVCSLVKKQLIE
jgi:hypothetical protein